MEELKRTLARNIRLARVRMNISQERLANEAGIDRTYVSSLEREKHDPTIKILKKIADVLETTPALLLTEGGIQLDDN